VSAARPLTGWDLLALGALGLVVRVPLIASFPAVHGGDSVVRLARADTLVLAYQLPLPQLLVMVSRWIHPGPLLARLVFALIGTLVAVALARALEKVAGPDAGRCGGILAALHPLLVYYSLVPYQEGSMLLLLLLGGHALRSAREGRAGLWLGLAAWCRYEAWIACALAAAARWRRPRAALLFVWAPLLWLGAWRGLSPAGTYVLDLDPEGPRLPRLLFVLGKLREYSGDTLLWLALAGVVFVPWRRSRGAARAAAFLLLVVLAVTLAGHEFPPGSGRVSERLAHLPALVACALGGVALGKLAASENEGALHRLGRITAVAALCGLGLSWHARTQDLLAAANRDPSLRLAVELTAFLEAHLPPGQRVAVVAPPVAADALDAYVRKVAASGGDTDTARAIARDLSRHAPDADRIAAHLARPPRTVVMAGERAALVVVFDDAPDATRWRRGAFLARFSDGPRSAEIYRPGP
jgi:hypothetical protein